MNNTNLPIDVILTNHWFKLGLIAAYMSVFLSTFVGKC